MKSQAKPSLNSEGQLVDKAWRQRALHELLSSDIRNGYSPVCPKEQTGRWMLTLGAAKGGKFDKTAVKPAPRDDSILERFQLKDGDFLVSRSNTADKVGLSCLFRGEIENCYYPDLLMRFRVDETLVIRDFMEQYLASSDAVCFLQSAAAGTSGSMKKITASTLRALPVQVPPLTEQRKIAAILTCWDKAIELVERLIEEKQVLKEAALASLLTPQKQADNKFGKWTVCQLGDLISEVNRRNKDLQIGNVLSVTNDRGFVAQNEQFSRQVASSDISNYKVVSEGEFAYNPSRINVGSIARLSNRKVGILSPMYVVFSVNGNLSADYLEQWFKSAATRGRIERSTQGSVRDSVAFSQLARLPIAVPKLEEQFRRARILQLMDRERSFLSNLKDHLASQKRGLMQQLLTGKMRVRV